MSTPTQTIHLSCACHLITGSFKTPPSSLPLPLTLCHCTTCRHQSGLLANTYAELPKTADLDINGPIHFYNSSLPIFRFFCPNCGANIYFEDTRSGDRAVCGGVLEGSEGVVRLERMIFLGDAGDGGLGVWMDGVEGWEGFSKESRMVGKGDWEEGRKGGERELKAHCLCKGVRFKITRPDEASARLTAPRGDIVGPPTAGDDEAWWLRENGTKYLGGTCACNECRLASGFDIQTWAFVPKANIKQLDGKPLDFSAGTLKRYDSSKGVYREFCGRCGATVFWHSDSRPDLIDVSVGLLDAEEGARADSWLDWETERVSFQEEAQNKDLISKLATGLKRWGESKGPSSAEKHDLRDEQTESDSKKPEVGGSD